jgi:hypothetical protein
LGERLDRTQEVGGSSPPSSIEKGPADGVLFSFVRGVARDVGLISVTTLAGRLRLELAREEELVELSADAVELVAVGGQAERTGTVGAD